MFVPQSNPHAPRALGGHYLSRPFLPEHFHGPQLRSPSPPDNFLAAGGVLEDLQSPSYYMTMSYNPRQQLVFEISKLNDMASAERLRWLEQQLSKFQCPYPIRQIELAPSGDAVVEFVSDEAMARSVSRASLKWQGQEIATRKCREDDIRSLFWVGVCGVGPEHASSARQALLPFGNVLGRCHQELDSQCSMLKFFFRPHQSKLLPPTLQLRTSPRKDSFPFIAKVITPYGPLAPRCEDFGANHNPFGCPECSRRQHFFQ